LNFKIISIEDKEITGEDLDGDYEGQKYKLVKLMALSSDEH